MRNARDNITNISEVMSKDENENPERLLHYSEHNECYTYFCITGEFEPDIITQSLGLTPDETWRIGDARRIGGVYEFSLWKFGTCRTYEVEVHKQMMKTIAPLIPKADILRELKESYGLEYTLEIVPSVRYDERTPSLAPSREVMKFCCDTDTDIDIDLYVSCPDEWEGDSIE